MAGAIVRHDGHRYSLGLGRHLIVERDAAYECAVCGFGALLGSAWAWPILWNLDKAALGGLNAPLGIAFGPDINGNGVGELYVGNHDTKSIKRYDVETKISFAF